MDRLEDLDAEVTRRLQRIKQLDLIEQVRLEALADLEDRIAEAQAWLAKNSH